MMFSFPGGPRREPPGVSFAYGSLWEPWSLRLGLAPFAAPARQRAAVGRAAGDFIRPGQLAAADGAAVLYAAWPGRGAERWARGVQLLAPAVGVAARLHPGFVLLAAVLALAAAACRQRLEA
ncbi:MAG: hypothetical protein ACOC9X_04195 [bacterium]